MAKQTRKKKITDKFEAAVRSTPDVAGCFQPGLMALGGYSSLIKPGNTSKCKGSIDIDDCTKTKYPQSNRWDYAIGYDGYAYFVEVHSAETGEVGTVLRKLQWLKDWLHKNAPEINKIKAAKPFYWIQSGRYSIFPGSPQARQVARAGIKPISKLELS